MTLYNSVSSAKSRQRVPVCTCSGMSLIYNKNSNGPMTVPWGTPETTASSLDRTPSTRTDCDLSPRKASIHCPQCPQRKSSLWHISEIFCQIVFNHRCESSWSTSRMTGSCRIAWNSALQCRLWDVPGSWKLSQAHLASCKFIQCCLESAGVPVVQRMSFLILFHRNSLLNDTSHLINKQTQCFERMRNTVKKITTR